MSEYYRVENEIDEIKTVGDLQEALTKLRLVADVPLSDGFGDPLILSVVRDMGTGELLVEIK